MADDLSVTHILRLRASANGTDRSEHRNRGALGHHHPGQPAASTSPQPAAPTPPSGAAGPVAGRTIPAPAGAPVLPVAVSDPEQHYQATWANAAAAIAAETAASLPGLSDDERRSATVWIDVLNDVAKDFSAGNIPPRPKPGELAAMLRG
jgi:hypothetical protein